MKNNKGITIIEIIISITLIAIVMLFLYTMLITVRNENERGKATSNLLISQVRLIKAIESDFIDNKLIGITSCTDGADITQDSVRKIVPSSSSLSTGTPAGFCLKFTFSDSDVPGYLLYYTYTYAGAVGSNPAIILPVIGYKRGDKKEIREVPLKASGKASVTRVCSTSPNYCSIKINMPVYNEDNEDYGIYLSYLYDSNTIFDYTISTDDRYNFNRS